MPRRTPSSLLLRGALTASLLGCAGAPPPTNGGTPTETVETRTSRSESWEEGDADAVAEALVGDALKEPWVDDWRTVHGGKKPVVRVHPMKNRSVNYIDYRYLTKQMEQAFVHSGRIDVVTSVDEAEAIRAERDDQSVHASDESAKSHGQELGSDFILTGSIGSEDLEDGSRRIRVYSTSVEIIETESGKKVWIGYEKVVKPLP